MYQIHFNTRNLQIMHGCKQIFFTYAGKTINFKLSQNNNKKIIIIKKKT